MDGLRTFITIGNREAVKVAALEKTRNRFQWRSPNSPRITLKQWYVKEQVS